MKPLLHVSSPTSKPRVLTFRQAGLAGQTLKVGHLAPWLFRISRIETRDDHCGNSSEFTFFAQGVAVIGDRDVGHVSTAAYRPRSIEDIVNAIIKARGACMEDLAKRIEVEFLGKNTFPTVNQAALMEFEVHFLKTCEFVADVFGMALT